MKSVLVSIKYEDWYESSGLSERAERSLKYNTRGTSGTLRVFFIRAPQINKFNAFALRNFRLLTWLVDRSIILSFSSLSAFLGATSTDRGADHHQQHQQPQQHQHQQLFIDLVSLSLAEAIRKLTSFIVITLSVLLLLLLLLFSLFILFLCFCLTNLHDAMTLEVVFLWLLDSLQNLRNFWLANANANKARFQFLIT